MKKALSVVLSLIMLLSVTTGFTTTAFATSITQSQAVSWANSQIGKHLDYDGVPAGNVYQCVDLTKYYYAYLGVSPVKGNGCDYATNALPSGWQRISYSSGFAAQPGDIAVWTYSTSANGHVAIVTSASTSTMNVVEQNASTGTRSHSYSYSYGTFWGVIRPNFSGSSSGNNPQGTFDIAEGKCGSVYVGGWAFDKDDSSKSLSIHVYIGGPAGSSGAEGHAITANAARSDVNSIYGISGNHGYGSEIITSKTGSQPVYVYAINTGGGDNTLLGSKTVNISNPNPIGALDIVEGKCGQVFVRGWAFDPNNTSKALSIHVYIGAGSTADGGEGHAITADTERKDVNSIHNCGANHGFSHTISTNKSGTQTVFVYAINIGSGNTVLLGSKTVTIRAGHSWNSGTVTTEETCTKAGVKTYTCSACGATKTETINPIGHNWDNGVVTTPATESENGIMTYTCQNCNDTKEVVIPVLTHTHTAAEAVKENEIAPTCTKDGYYDLVVYCSIGDGYEFSRETLTVPATGHSFTNYVSNCDATCSSDGTKTAKCDYCDATDTIVDEGTKLEHEYIAITTMPSCLERGYTTHICKFCGDSYISDYTEKSEHTIVFDDAVAATCTQNGATAGAHCSVCGKVFIAQDAVDALGHTWNEGTVTKNSTYTETGIKEYKCTVCGAIKTETVQKLPKKANTLTVKAKKPTVKFAKLKKKNQTIVRKYAITVSKAKGTVTYTKSSGNKKITVSKAGKITVKKGLKKGTYKVKIKITAAGNATYKAATKTVTVKIKVK